jgi:hypothetical protein
MSLECGLLRVMTVFQFFSVSSGLQLLEQPNQTTKYKEKNPMSMSKKSKTTSITASILFLTLLGTPLLKPAAALAGNYRVCAQEYIYRNGRPYLHTRCETRNGRLVERCEGVTNNGRSVTRHTRCETRNGRLVERCEGVTNNGHSVTRCSRRVIR